MTRSIRGSRRAAVLLAGMVAATSMLLSGCGAGQIAETAYKQSSIGGINAQTPDNRYLVRNLHVAFLNSAGYAAGANAPLGVVIYNQTAEPVTVTVTSDSARSVELAGAGASTGQSAAASASPSGSAPASPSGPASPSPSATSQAPTGPARIDIPADGFAQLNPESGSFLQIIGLSQALKPGNTVKLIFDFGGKGRIETQVPVASPLTPPPAATPIIPAPGAGEAHEG